MIYKSRSNRAWRRRWQVVCGLDDGAVIVVSTHRSEFMAAMSMYVRNLADRSPDRACDVRRNPGVTR